MSRPERTPWGPLALLTAAGAVLRFWRIGAKSLWGNEDYLAIGVRSILENGTPLFPSGVVYPRGLPLSYITAGLASLFGVTETVLRAPSAIFSTLCIPLTWWLARQIFDRRTAWIAAGLVAVSFWEVSTGQTARMYAMLGFSLLATLAALYRSEVQERFVWRMPALVMIVVACFVHQIAGVIGPLAVLLAVFLFMKRGRLGLVPLALVVVLFGVSANFLTESHFYGLWSEKVEAAVGAQEVPAETAPNLNGLKRIAAPLYTKVRAVSPSLGRVTSWFFIFAAAMAGLLALARPTRRLFYLSIIPLTFTLYYQQLSLALIVVLGFYLLGRFNRNPRVGREALTLLGGVIGGCAVWGALALVALPWGPFANAKFAVKALLAYPPNFLRVFLETFPWLTLVFLLAAFSIVRRALEERRFTQPLLMLLWFLVPIVLLGLHPLALVRLYERYVYFLNPLFLILVACGIATILGPADKPTGSLRRGLGIAGVAALLLLSGGASLYRSVAWVSGDHGLMEGLYDRSIGRQIFVPDFRGPARFVCESAAESDKIVATDILAHYSYCDRVDFQFTLSSKRDAEGWIGARTLPSQEALAEYLDRPREHDIWFVTSGLQDIENRELRSTQKDWAAAMEAVEQRGESVFTGADGSSQVYRITPRTAPPQKTGS